MTRTRSTSGRTAGGLIAAAVAVAAAATLATSARLASAADRDVVVRWIQPDGPPVTGYFLHLTSDATGATSRSDIGFVPADVTDVRSHTIALDAADGFHIRVSAYNDAGESELSDAVYAAPSLCDPTLCDDGDPCTADDCATGGCVSQALPDGTSCGLGGDGLPLVCLDGLCGAPECVVDAECGGLGACAGELACVGYVCAKVATCEAECTVDAGCSDGDACNGIETCADDGTCVAAAPLDCGASTQCADPVCDPHIGCLMMPRPDGTRCDDGRKRTAGDQCLGGVCIGERRKPGRGKGRDRVK